MADLTPEEQATNNQTHQHIDRVRQLLNRCIQELLTRGEQHDQSKLKPPESDTFAKYTHKLKNCEYMSEEYKQCLKEMQPALQNHYKENRHHPEHFQTGISGMNLIDILEMICDWKASSERHENGDIYKSIKINTERFGLTPQLAKILENTAREFWPSSD